MNVIMTGGASGHAAESRHISLFFNAVLSVALVAGVVVAILCREHLPVIRRLEAAESAQSRACTMSGIDHRQERGVLFMQLNSPLNSLRLGGP
jgi:hypothetical protein